ncbi:hypothetical protein BHM03_00057126 [Ensete ventricosum]|nr:hypothetical protein BHM03_00057126 [Ensete ventricosum]
MLDAYDGSSDPTEHVAMFYEQMTLYGTLDVIISAPRVNPPWVHPLGSQGEGWKEMNRPCLDRPMFRSTPLERRSSSRSEKRDS